MGNCHADVSAANDGYFHSSIISDVLVLGRRQTQESILLNLSRPRKRSMNQHRGLVSLHEVGKTVFLACRTWFNLSGRLALFHNVLLNPNGVFFTNLEKNKISP